MKALRIFSEKTKSIEESLDINLDNADKVTHNSKKSNYFISSYYCDHTPMLSIEESKENKIHRNHKQKSMNQN